MTWTVFSGRNLSGEGRWASVTFREWGTNAPFPALRSHLQLILGLAPALGVAGAASVTADSMFSRSVWCGVLRPRPSATRPSLRDPACPPQASLSSAAAKLVPAPSTSHSAPRAPRYKEPAKEGDITGPNPGGLSAARFLRKADWFCPNSDITFAPSPEATIVHLLGGRINMWSLSLAPPGSETAKNSGRGDGAGLRLHPVQSDPPGT